MKEKHTEDDVIVAMDWDFSNDALHALHHPRASSSQKHLKELARRIGLARVRLANSVVERLQNKG